MDTTPMNADAKDTVNDADVAPTAATPVFADFDLHEPLLRSLDKLGFSAPTEIQQQTIPAQMDGRDMVGLAQTGGGKTAAFLLPLMNKLMTDHVKPVPHHPHAVILVPTREIAMQITNAIRDLIKGTGLFYATVYGGAPMHFQIKDLKKGCDILVATPGRLADHIRQGTVSLSDVQSFILDEADRMLDMGFVNEVRDFAADMPSDRQTVLFSATMPKAVDKLVKELVNKPVRIDTGIQEGVPESVVQNWVTLKGPDKPKALVHFLVGDADEEDLDAMEKTIIFARTKRGTDNLVEALRRAGVRADGLHGDKQQRVRQRLLNDFRKGKLKVLVATDVAARGIDVKDVTRVINYDMPEDVDTYVHRVGRTGRAGAEGRAFSFITNSEIGLMRRIEKVLGQRVEVFEDHPFHNSGIFKMGGDDSRARGYKGKGGGRPGRGFGGGGRGKPGAGNGKPGGGKRFAGGPRGDDNRRKGPGGKPGVGKPGGRKPDGGFKSNNRKQAGGSRPDQRRQNRKAA